jgi:predicted transcriptional regulator
MSDRLELKYSNKKWRSNFAIQQQDLIADMLKIFILEALDVIFCFQINTKVEGFSDMIIFFLSILHIHVV